MEKRKSLIGAGLFLVASLIISGGVKAATYSEELTDAYNRAHSNAIISESNIDDANMYSAVTNAELASIMAGVSRYLGITFDGEPSQSCWFDEEPSEEISNLCLMYGLGRMDESLITFENADNNATQATFGTALSRVLWGNKYDGGNPYYVNHLNALKAAGIINQIDNPEDTTEIKGYVLLMLMRSLEGQTYNEDTKVITLKSGLNTFSTPAIIKSISFSNGGSNISFSKMEKGERKAMTVNNSNVRTTVKPLEGYIIRNSNTNDVTMTIEYDTDNSDSLTLSKNLNAGWNFLGITTTNNPFNNIASTTATMILDLTNGGDTNLIQLGKTFIQATRFTLGKAYAVFVNNSGTYGGINNYGDDDEELFKSCRLNPDVLCQLDDQGHLLTPETCPSYCLREELINNISESVEYTKGESSEKEVFNGYFKSKKGTIGINKINIFCGNEEGFCFNNMIFYLNIGQSNYIINNQGSLTLNNISVEENKSIPISIYAYTNNSNFESIGKYTYYLRLNLSNGDENSRRLVPMYVKNPGGQTYENRLVYGYERAYENGIIPEGNIDDAGLYNTLSNASMKTILLNFASNLGLNSNSTLELFSDLLADEESPTNRANFGTALSRILRGDKYDGGNPYYTNHLNALKTAGIMNQIDNPTETLEIKGYVLAMLMEASRIYSVDCNDPLVVLACSDLENYYYESCPVRCRNNIYQYPDELVEAYNWAYENGIISESTIDNANLYANLTNLKLADIMNKYAENVLDQTPDTSKSCTFSNTSGFTESEIDIITKSCQLGLMPIDNERYELTNRGIFGTALSRALWGDNYEGGNPYYANHLNALKTAGIMNQIDKPYQSEIRGYILTTLKRASEYNSEIDCDNDLIRLACELDSVECPLKCRNNSICGNGIVEEGENCANCPTDLGVICEK